MAQTYEVEIKSLLGSAERAAALRDALKAADADCELISQSSQLNHYFEPDTERGGSLEKLASAVSEHLTEDMREELAEIAASAGEYSLRSRDKDNIVLLVIKASTGDGTSANGVSRLEFEAQVPLTLAELDEIILAAGFKYQAKWSREREEYACRGINVCIDKNAGYGYVAEFERMVNDPAAVADARREVEAFMHALGVDELPQDRLERMFAHYNKHWQKYYGTDKIFIIE